MKCPACQAAMAALEYEEVEVDYCLSCRGVWLDAGELELLFGSREMSAGFLTGGDRMGTAIEAARPCPICREVMAKHRTGGTVAVLYDACPKGHGMWFDRGELGAVLVQGSSAPGGEEVVAWLRGMFQEAPRGE